MLYILTNGKEYVMENPYKVGDYSRSTSPNHAKKFVYKDAKSLLHRKGKKLSWIREFYMVDVDTGEQPETSPNYKGKAGIYIGCNDFDFNMTLLDNIERETKNILGLTGWNKQQLETTKNELRTALSKYDSAEQDITHAVEEYKKKHDGKKPQAHKMAKLGYLLEDVRETRRRIKQCQDYIQVMLDAITYKYDITKLRLELSKAEHGEYKGRTEYYAMAIDILG